MLELVEWHGPPDERLKRVQAMTSRGFTQNGLIRWNANPTLLFEAIPNGFQLRSGEIAASIHWQCGTLTTSAN
jgi:hypothetical protein